MQIISLLAYCSRNMFKILMLLQTCEFHICYKIIDCFFLQGSDI